MVTLNTEELDDMKEKMEKGALPKDALKRHYEAEARNVFGFDAKKDRNGEYIEQGIGAKGHETANHFAALKKAERENFEEPGTYRRALAEIWKRDPKRAKALHLPQPPAEDEPRPARQGMVA